MVIPVILPHSRGCSYGQVVIGLRIIDFNELRISVLQVSTKPDPALRVKGSSSLDYRTGLQSERELKAP